MGWALSYPARAATMKYHNLGGSNNRMGHLTVLEGGSPRSRWHWGQFLQRPVKETLFLAFLLAAGGLLAIFGIPWLIDHYPHLHMVFSLCACLCPNFLFIRTLVLLD